MVFVLQALGMVAAGVIGNSVYQREANRLSPGDRAAIPVSALQLKSVPPGFEKFNLNSLALNGTVDILVTKREPRKLNPAHWNYPTKCEGVLNTPLGALPVVFTAESVQGFKRNGKSHKGGH